MDYSQHMLARAEHNLMVKSLPVVSDNGNNNGSARRPVQWVRSLLMSVLHLVIK